jgi:hypothetical protein
MHLVAFDQFLGLACAGRRVRLGIFLGLITPSLTSFSSAVAGPFMSPNISTMIKKNPVDLATVFMLSTLLPFLSFTFEDLYGPLPLTAEFAAALHPLIRTWCFTPYSLVIVAVRPASSKKTFPEIRLAAVKSHTEALQPSDPACQNDLTDFRKPCIRGTIFFF